jgi:hypothetical protein
MTVDEYDDLCIGLLLISNEGALVLLHMEGCIL